MTPTPQRDSGASIAQRPVSARRDGPANPFIRFEKSEVEQSIPARFEKIVRLYPGRVAVKAVGTTLTYDALNRAANSLARAILAHAPGANRLVALFTDHSVAPFIGLLAILKAGKAHAVLNPLSPLLRNRDLLDNAQAGLIVTDARWRAAALDLAGDLPVLCIDDIPSGHQDTDLDQVISPDDLACVIYTSGSSGEPKGVVHSQRTMLHVTMRHVNPLHLCPDDRHSLITNCGHLMWTTDTYKVLLSGAALYAFDARSEGTGQLASWLTNEGITIYRSVPTTYRHLFAGLAGDERLEGIRAVLLGGETIRKSDVELFRRHFAPSCLLGVSYGLTETGFMCRSWLGQDAEIKGPEVPVGYPAEDIEIKIRDEDGRDAESGATGEILARSRYLALGYWRNPELTAAAFLPDLQDSAVRLFRTGDIGRINDDGSLVHLGRKDDQVKVRGFRIEVAEVEDALLRLPAVSLAVVVARPDATGEQRLVAYLVARTHPTPTVSAIRQEISRTLPPYMIPAAFVFLHALPLTATGKIDRRALPDPGSGRPELDVAFVAPRTPLEETLAAIWTQVLGIAPIGVNDNFFDLGGDSLKSARVMTRVSDLHGVSVTPARFFESPTPAGLALAITQAQAAQMEQGEIERLLAEVESRPEEQEEQYDAHAA